jgi:hypothetical protein
MAFMRQAYTYNSFIEVPVKIRSEELGKRNLDFFTTFLEIL